jgi:hypothetical protein
LRWDGRIWAVAHQESHLSIDSLAGASGDDIWASGYDRGSGALVLLHYNGVSWSPAPVSFEGRLLDMHSFGPHDVWAAGITCPGHQNPCRGLLLHYDGSLWSEVFLEHAEYYFATWGHSPTDLYVAGQDGILLHFDGESWTRQRTGVRGGLTGIFGLGAETWISGSHTVLHKVSP